MVIKDVFVKYIKKHFCSRWRIIAFGLVAFLLIVYAVLGTVMSSIISGLPEFLLADRWSSKGDMAQVSIYTTEDQLIDQDSIKRFDYMLEKKLAEAGVDDPDDDVAFSGPKVVDTIGIDEMNKEPKEDAPVNERKGIRKLYSVSYCAQGQVSITFENRTADKVSAIGCGGDFFLFHPMEFVTGAPFSGDDLMKDSIVIDETLAWQLFGSTDIIGQMVTIGGVPHYVAGVVKRDTGKLKKAAGLDKSYVYMSYESLSIYGMILSGRTVSQEISELGTKAEKGGISCIEVVCPNSVKGMAARVCKDSHGVTDEFVEVIDNTERFSFFSLLNVIRGYGTRSMWNKAIYYPYWENVARGYEDILATLLLVRILCMSVVIILIVISIVNAYRKKTWTVRSVVKALAEKKYDLEAEHQQKKCMDA